MLTGRGGAIDMKARVGTRGSSVLGGADDLKTLGRSSMLMGAAEGLKDNNGSWAEELVD